MPSHTCGVERPSSARGRLDMFYLAKQSFSPATSLRYRLANGSTHAYSVMEFLLARGTSLRSWVVFRRWVSSTSRAARQVSSCHHDACLRVKLFPFHARKARHLFCSIGASFCYIKTEQRPRRRLRSAKDNPSEPSHFICPRSPNLGRAITMCTTFPHDEEASKGTMCSPPTSTYSSETCLQCL